VDEIKDELYSRTEFTERASHLLSALSEPVFMPTMAYLDDTVGFIHGAISCCHSGTCDARTADHSNPS
jgi:hypothetical protein